MTSAGRRIATPEDPMETYTHDARRLFNVDEFYRMSEVGILPMRGVELIDGDILELNGRGTPRRWTYDEYVQMGEAGILSGEERTELIRGEIVCMTPVGHRHVYVVDLLTERLGEWARGKALLRVQSPLKFNDMEAPQPDLCLLRLHEDRYLSREAGPWDALLVVEVSDSSVQRDRDVKGPMYARAAIPEFWLVDLNRNVLVVHEKPAGGEYTQVREYAAGDAWISPALGGREVRTDDVLGPGSAA
jgi:Uma2 family endonuclease